MTSGLTLADRVHEHLLANGPSYAARLAEDLACPSRGSVTAALGVLRRRGLVAIVYEEAAPRCGTPRRFYAAVATALGDGDALLGLELRFACGGVDRDAIEAAL